MTAGDRGRIHAVNQTTGGTFLHAAFRAEDDADLRALATYEKLVDVAGRSVRNEFFACNWAGLLSDVRSR